MLNKFNKMLVIGTIFLLLLSSSITLAYFNENTKTITTTKSKYESVFDEPNLDQYQNETEGNATVPFGVFSPDNEIKLAQSFKPTYPVLSKIEILLEKKINPNSVEVSIKESLASSQSLFTFELNNPSISSYPTWTTVNLPDINVTPEETYFIICSTTASAIFIYEWHYGQIDGYPFDNYDRGQAYTYENNVWNPTDVEGKIDFCFKTYGKIGPNIPPVVNFSFTPKNPKIDETIIFDASASYDPDGEIILYKWDWDSNGIYDETQTIPLASYSWDESDNYEVTLQVIDNMNMTSIITKNVTVYDIIVPDDYPTIQNAVDVSDHGYWIYVRPGGTYNENIKIGIERLHLEGGNKLNTTINGQNKEHVIDVLDNAHHVEISGFRIKNSGDGYAGINLQSFYNNILDNNIVENDYGIHIKHSSGNQIFTNNLQNNNDAISIHNESFASFISNNNITQNQQIGIYIDKLSNGHVIQKNTIIGNIYGIIIKGISKSTTVRENIIKDNNIGVNCIFFSDGNRFFYNTFEDNNLNAYDSSIDRWDNNKIGNYWDDYTGIDSDGDGIGDTPYPIPGGENEDRFPLMYPWGPPIKPLPPLGEIKGKIRQEYEYSTMSTDPDNDFIKYGWDWNGDMIADDWTDYHPSGEIVSIRHTFTLGDHQIRVKAKDIHDQSSAWSDPLNVSISRNLIKFSDFLNKYVKYINPHILSRIITLLDQGIELSYEKNCVSEKKQPLQSYTDKSIIYVPDDYPTIQEAIDNSKDLDNIIVRPGIYNEHLIVDKELTITGEDRNQTIIEGNYAKQHIIEIKSNNVHIKNFTIQNCNISHSGIRIWTDNNTFVNNTILNCGGGIEMFWTKGNMIKANHIINNTFAILFSDSSNCSVVKNFITYNQYGLEFGLTLYGIEKSSIQLENNFFDTNKEYGILLLRIDEMIIGNNTVKDHKLIGTGIFSGRNIRFYNNDFFENAKDITLHNSQKNTFMFNNFLDNSPLFNYFGGDLINSNIGICTLYKSNNNIICDNSFENWCNAYDMCSNFYDTSSEGNNCRGNYWNDYTGVDNDGNGIGDTPYQIPGGNNIDSCPLMNP
jgi:parallel beta-helix repeat protein